jgi:hypothetical protein
MNEKLRMDAHSLECALAAAAARLERAIDQHGSHSAEAKEWRKFYNDLLEAEIIP